MERATEISVLALEPYYGGSHKAFIDSWIERSRHKWTLLSLPAHHWKWRMRHSAIYFAEETAKLIEKGKKFDAVFCSSMLNFAEFAGLLPACGNLKSILYFHENQLTYPMTDESLRDYQNVFTQMISALAASEVWFNSAFNRSSFLEGLRPLLKRMPDFQPYESIDKIFQKSAVFYPGIKELPERKTRKKNKAFKILWAARWESDKNPEDFFDALKILKSKGFDFRLSVLGEQFRNSPSVFREAKKEFKKNIDRWGYIESRTEYIEELMDADAIVSTALHEFFGIGMLEGAAAGAVPILPKRQAYPEVFSDEAGKTIGNYFYSGSPENLADKIMKVAEKILKGKFDRNPKKVAEKYYWSKAAINMDNALEELVKK